MKNFSCRVTRENIRKVAGLAESFLVNFRSKHKWPWGMEEKLQHFVKLTKVVERLGGLKKAKISLPRCPTCQLKFRPTSLTRHWAFLRRQYPRLMMFSPPEHRNPAWRRSLNARVNCTSMARAHCGRCSNTKWARSWTRKFVKNRLSIGESLERRICFAQIFAFPPSTPKQHSALSHLHLSSIKSNKSSSRFGWQLWLPRKRVVRVIRAVGARHSQIKYTKVLLSLFLLSCWKGVESLHVSRERRCSGKSQMESNWSSTVNFSID